MSRWVGSDSKQPPEGDVDVPRVHVTEKEEARPVAEKEEVRPAAGKKKARSGAGKKKARPAVGTQEDAPSSRPALHPAWREGQYVTYVLTRDDGSWAALAMSLVSWSEERRLLLVDVKDETGDGTVFIRPDPYGAPDPEDISAELRREAAGGKEVDFHVADNPGFLAPLALNLLLVRDLPYLSEVLQRPPRKVGHPCGLETCHRVISEGTGYEKHHDMNPAVPLTGVACLSVDGKRNPLTVTSFGVRDGSTWEPGSADDFVDLSHPKPTEHRGFTMTYPATWFLRSEGEEAEETELADAALEEGERAYRVQLGGPSCALALSLSVFKGAPEEVAAMRASESTSVEVVEGWARHEEAPLALEERGVGAMFTRVDGANTCRAVRAVLWNEAGDVLTTFTASGAVVSARADCEEVLSAMERVLGEAVESFRFT
ncbi:hypothetical protein [Chondromyces crocatus]|uniref:hypothetical protein n=1 Tax=Chondromyces crocatus TaxID=52 RepID=UPI0012E2DEC3|nr:hypothetical protein [Chondromyces crocatus]